MKKPWAECSKKEKASRLNAMAALYSDKDQTLWVDAPKRRSSNHSAIFRSGGDVLGVLPDDEA